MFRYGYTVIWFLLVIALGVGAYFALSQLSYEIVYEGEGVETTSPVLVYDENANSISDEPVESSEDPDTGNSPDSEEPEESSSSSSSSDYADLIDRMNRLITEYGGTMKEGSRGTRVGTVQEFLNIYLDTDKTVDNQYGPGTRADVREFQEKEGLDADGLAGPGTFTKMKEWLESQ